MHKFPAFDKRDLATKLQQLPPLLRVVFAAACSERQFPQYREFYVESAVGDAEDLRSTLDDIWTNLDIPFGEAVERQQELKPIMKLISQEDVVRTWTDAATYAQNAGISVAYALRTQLTGDPQEAIWSARTAYDSLDHYVINAEGIDANEPSGEARVLAHPLVQAEVSRQARDLAELMSSNGSDIRELAQRARKRATLESRLFFQVPS